MEGAIRAACDAAAGLLDEYAPVQIVCERYIEKHPHPGGQEAFSVRARFPWHRQPHTRVMVEISMDEQVLKPTPSRTILHEYGEPLTATVRVYSLEEIVAEKLRAILQHAEMLNERGWSRSRARDFYDLWRILGSYRDQMDFADFAPFVAAKCAVRQVTFIDAEDFFQPAMLAHVQGTWNRWLEPLVPDLPPFETVIGNLRPQIERLLSREDRRRWTGAGEKMKPSYDPEVDILRALFNTRPAEEGDEERPCERPTAPTGPSALRLAGLGNARPALAPALFSAGGPTTSPAGRVRPAGDRVHAPAHAEALGG